MERRLIDANELMKNVGKIPQLRGVTYGRMKKAVEETTTISAVEVVRCRECKMQRRCGNMSLVWCNKWGNVMAVDAFCAYGERRKPDA